jgi:hypothetical protein
MRTRIGK